MRRILKIIGGKIIIEFDSGKFDDYCVYLTRPPRGRFAPLDTEYFTILKAFASIYGGEKIYNDFVSIYPLTTKHVNQNVLYKITQISRTYPQHSEEIDIWFTVIYAGMIAEENKANAILKKRIKRLGMYQILIEKHEAFVAANYSKGIGWRILDAHMKERGF